MECKVHQQMFKFLDETKLISKHQFGFQKKKLTELAATVLLGQVRLIADNGSLVGASFIDLQKAFNTISHNKLISKLEHYSMRDKELDWFKSYLFNQQIRVYQNGSLSEEKPVYTGVPQGSILGPLLFVLFFIDISSHLKYSKIVKYADGTVIFCENSRLPTIEHQLDEDLQNLNRWFEENKLLINLKSGKTELLLFGTSQRMKKTNKNFEVKSNNQYINETKSYKYLGVEVDHNLYLNFYFDKTYKKMASRLRLLNKLRLHMTISVAVSIYNMIIVPLFSYCSLLKPTLMQTQVNSSLSFERR